MGCGFAWNPPRQRVAPDRARFTLSSDARDRTLPAGNGAAFVRSQSGEPHAHRRRVILAAHPEVRALAGHDTRTAWVTLACLVAQLAIAAALQAQAHRGGWLGSWWGIALVAYGVGTVLAHWLGMTIHETSHNLAFRSRRANMALAIFANLALVVPIAMTFRRYHLDHHRLLGVEREDTDLPRPIEVRVVRDRPLRKLVWLAFYFVVYGLRGLSFARSPNRREVAGALIVLAADALLVAFVGPVALAYLFLSLFFAHSLHPLAAHYIHEHYTFRDGQETYSYYGPLNHVTFNVGYHVEHHDFVNVPGWRLPALRRLADEYYAPLASHTSWTVALLEFVARRGFGVGSRVVRSREDFARGRFASHARMRDSAARFAGDHDR